MSHPPVEAKAWSRHRWALMILLILTGQIGCIFWLASQNPDSPPPPAPGSVLYLPADQTADLPGVTDPTLFILPNSHGFSGPAWLQVPPTSYALDPWTEPPRPLELSLSQLGATLRDYSQTNQPRPFELALKPEPQLEALGYLPLEEAPSTFAIEGDLANRPLLTTLKLKSWPAADILTNSEVQVAVDAAGRVFSAALVTSSGSPQANASAVNLLRSARFQPLRWVSTPPPPAAPGPLTWGKIIFRWRTEALPATAASATK